MEHTRYRFTICCMSGVFNSSTPYRLICDHLWASIFSQKPEHKPANSQLSEKFVLFAYRVEENTIVNPADGYYSSVQGLANFVNLAPSLVDQSWWIQQFCTRPCELHTNFTNCGREKLKCWSDWFSFNMPELSLKQPQHILVGLSRCQHMWIKHLCQASEHHWRGREHFHHASLHQGQFRN
jgi:hypothetical protein